jgi:hypothetical protein
MVFKDAKIAYLILIDQSAKVVWRHAGNLDEETYRAPSSQVVKLLASK